MCNLEYIGFCRYLVLIHNYLRLRESILSYLISGFHCILLLLVNNRMELDCLQNLGLKTANKDSYGTEIAFHTEYSFALLTKVCCHSCLVDVNPFSYQTLVEQTLFVIVLSYSPNQVTVSFKIQLIPFKRIKKYLLIQTFIKEQIESNE